MIEEDYVIFETAKLLKEKRFYGHCHSFYEADENGKFLIASLTDNSRSVNYDNREEYQMPTLQMVMKWLRETFGFQVCIDFEVDYDEDERGTKYYYEPGWYWQIYRIRDRKQLSDDPNLYVSYEQACEAAIKFCLEKLI